MTKWNSVFTRKNSDSTTISLKVPTSLKARIDNINTKLKKIDPDLHFSYQEKIRNEIEKLVKIAEGELEKKERKSTSKTVQVSEYKEPTKESEYSD